MPVALLTGSLWMTAGTGYAQRCLHFDGTQSARVPTARAAPVPMGDFTVGAFVRQSSAPITARQTIVGSLGGPNALPWALVLRPDRSLAFNWQTTTGQWLEVPGPGVGGGAPNQWHYCGVIVTTDEFAKGEIRLFFDSAPETPGLGETNLVAYHTDSGLPVAPPAFATGGAGSCSLVVGSGFVGELDDVFVADEAVPLNRVYDWAYEPMASGEVSLLGYWRFDASGVDSTPSSAPRATTLEFLHGCGPEGAPTVQFSDAPVPGWSPDMNREFAAMPVQIRNQTTVSGVTASAFQPALASDGNLTALLTSTGTAVQVRTSDGRGLGFGTPKTISSTQLKNIELAKSNDSSLLVFGSNILAVWKDGRFDNPSTPAIEQELFFAGSINGGLTWGAEQRVNWGFPLGSRVIGEFSLGISEVPGTDFNLGLAAVSGGFSYPVDPIAPAIGYWKIVQLPVAPYFQLVYCPPTLPPIFGSAKARFDQLALELLGYKVNLAVTVDPYNPLQGVDTPDADVWYVPSFDQGFSWSFWQPLDTSGPAAGHAFGMLALTSLESGVAVGWTETADILNPKRSLYVALSNDFGQSFAPAQIYGGYVPGLHDVIGGDIAFAGIGGPVRIPNLLVAWSDDRWGQPLPFAVTVNGVSGLTLPEFGFSRWLPDDICPPWPDPLPWPPQPLLPCPPFCWWPPPPPPCPPWCPSFEPLDGFTDPIHIHTHWRGRLDTNSTPSPLLVSWKETLANGIQQLRATFPLQNGSLWQRSFKVLESSTQSALQNFAMAWNPSYKNVIAAGKFAGQSQVSVGGFRGSSLALETRTSPAGFRFLFDGTSALGTRPDAWAFDIPMPMPIIVGFTVLSLSNGSLPVQTSTGLLDLGIAFDSATTLGLGDPRFQAIFSNDLAATPWVNVALPALQGVGLRAVGILLEDFFTSFEITGISDPLNF
jgi:hypothetical protein